MQDGQHMTAQCHVSALGAHRRPPDKGISGARHEVRSESGYPQQARVRLVTFPSFFTVPNRGEAIVRNLDAKQPAKFSRETAANPHG